MKIFVDSINIEMIKSLTDKKFVDGMTTNPNLMKKGKISKIEFATEVCKFSNLPLSIQVKNASFKEMRAEAEEIVKIAPNIVIKIPITQDGIMLSKHLSSIGIPVNMTLCFSLSQALLVARSGAAYISPFIGRIDDSGNSGFKLIQNIKDMYSRYGYKTQIIAASIRNTRHIEESMIAGADIATMSADLILSMDKHHLTTIGLAEFNVSDIVEE